MWKEFKTFAMRGNIVDLAIGVVIGARSVRSSHRSLMISLCL